MSIAQHWSIASRIVHFIFVEPQLHLFHCWNVNTSKWIAKGGLMWDLFGDSSQLYAFVEYVKMKETFKRKVIRSFVQIARFFELLTLLWNIWMFFFFNFTKNLIVVELAQVLKYSWCMTKLWSKVNMIMVQGCTLYSCWIN